MAVYRRVVELDGFAAAARDLRMSNGSVSKHVARLEEQLSVRLLNRTTRRISLTEAGRGFYERCVRILDEVEEAKASAASESGSPRGTLRVNAPMSFGIRHLAQALPEFMARYPDLAVDLSLNDRYVSLLDEGYDVAVRIGSLADSGLVARRVGTSRLLPVAAPSYLAARGEPQTPRDLLGHECLSYTLRSSGGEWRFHGPEGPVSVRVSGRLRVDNGDVLATAAAAGLGIVLSPAFLVDDLLRDGRLRVVLPGYRTESADIHAVFPHSRHLSAKVRVFVDFLAEKFGSEAPWRLETEDEEQDGLDRS